MRNLLKLVTIGLIGLILILGILCGLGYGITVITSSSMTPELQTNALVITKTVPYEEIEELDIIQYQADKNGQVMHRVKQKTLVDTGIIYYLTKGDNNEFIDTFIATEATYKAKVIWHCNAVAPIITLIFGSFLTITKVRLILGLLLIGISMIFILGVVINSIMKGVKL